MGTLLLVTCGTSDLQFVVQSGTGPVRVLAANGTQRRLHAALLIGTPSYSVFPEGENLPVSDQFRIAMDADGNVYRARDDLGGRESQCEAAIDTPIRIVPAKLSGLNTLIGRNLKPDAVVIFATNRDNDQREPVAAGKILSGWAANIFGLTAGLIPSDIGLGISGWFDFLTEDMAAEGPNGLPVNPVAVRKIDAALQKLLSTGDWSTVILATAGGIPRYRDELRAVARFRFPEARLLDFHQSARRAVSVSEVNEVPLPSENYRIRGQVREMIRNSDFFAAGILANLYSDERWAKEVTLVVQFLNGTLGPVSQAPDYLAPSIRANAPFCLLPAFRTEVALRSGRILDALLWTSTFVEAALMDGIAQLPFVESIDLVARNCTVKEGMAVPASLMAAQTARTAPPLKLLNEAQRIWEVRTGKEIDRAWFDAFGKLGQRLAEMRSVLSKKVSLHAADGLTPRRSIPLYEIRNIAVHSAVPPQLMSRADDEMVAAGLWAAGAPATRFLQQDLVVAVFKCVGRPEPSKNLQKMTEGLILSVSRF